MPGNEAETAEQASDICRRFDTSEYAVESAKYIDEHTPDDVINFLVKGEENIQVTC